MSRLDYITIAIVAACILAIIFLIYKMTDLFNENAKEDKIEQTSKQVEVAEDDMYDISEEPVETDTADAGNLTDHEEQPAAAKEEPAVVKTTTPEKKPEPVVSTPAVKTTSKGKFMVIAGTFSRKDLAQQHVDKLKKLGFKNASMEYFDKGKYAVVLADRFDNMANAERLVKELEAKGMSSYVKIKDGGR